MDSLNTYTVPGLDGSPPLELVDIAAVQKWATAQLEAMVAIVDLDQARRDGLDHLPIWRALERRQSTLRTITYRIEGSHSRGEQSGDDLALARKAIQNDLTAAGSGYWLPAAESPLYRQLTKMRHRGPAFALGALATLRAFTCRDQLEDWELPAIPLPKKNLLPSLPARYLFFLG